MTKRYMKLFTVQDKLLLKNNTLHLQLSQPNILIN